MLLAHLRRFWSHREGNIAMMLAVASIPLVGFAGAAVDYGFASRLRTRLQAAADASALMLCQTPLTTTSTDLNAKAQTNMLSYMGNSVGLVTDPLTITQNPRKISLTGHATSNMFFGNFLSRTANYVVASSQCATPMPRTFEIALVLDTTGSMSESGGNGSKLSALQTAASNFVDYVKNNTAFASDTRIAIVPFSAAVNVGASYASSNWVDSKGVSKYHWTNVDKALATASKFTSRLDIFAKLALVNSSWGWGGCFEMLPYPFNTQDGVPSTNDTLFVPMFAPDEPGNGGGGNYGVAFKDNTNTTYTSYNSYINDTTSASNCTASPTTFQSAENSACKYVSATGAVSYNYGLFGMNGPNFMCASKPLQRLTTNASTLKSLISTFTAAGQTNIHDGLMWGWRVLSPNSVFADGVAYSSTTTTKIIVLMTDGFNTWYANPYKNYNQSIFSQAGFYTNADASTPNDRMPSGSQYQNLSNATNARNALDALTLEGCTNAQRTGISIYTVGFSVSSDPIDSQGINMLANCASSSTQAYVANDSDSLIAAFAKIASSIGALRLSQ